MFLHAAADLVGEFAEHLRHRFGFALRFDERLADAGVGDEAVVVGGVMIPTFEAGGFGEDHVGESGLFAVADVDSDVEGDELFIAEDFTDDVGFGVTEGGTEGEGHVDAHLLAAFGDVGIDQLADAHGVPMPRERVFGWGGEFAVVFLLPAVGEGIDAVLGFLGKFLECGLVESFAETPGHWGGGFGFGEGEFGQAFLAVASGPAPEGGEAVAAGLADIADEDVEGADEAVGLHAVVVLGGTTIGHGAASRSRFGELDGDALDVGSFDAGKFFGPLGGVVFDLLAEVFERVVGPPVPEFFVFEAFLEDDVDHRSGDRAVGAGHDGVELVRLARGVRGTDFEGDELGSFVDDGFLQAMDHEESALVGFVGIAAEVDDVFGVLEVLGFPFELTSVEGHEGRASVRRANRAAVEAMRSAEGVGEMFGDAFGFVATVVEDEFLGRAIFAQRAELVGEFGVGFVPGDALPLAFATFSDAAERVEDSLGVVGVGNHALGLRADVALGVRVEWVAFDFFDNAVLDPADDAAVVGAGEADRGRGFGFGVIESAGWSAGLGVLGGDFEWREGAGEKGCAELEEVATIEIRHGNCRWRLFCS